MPAFKPLSFQEIDQNFNNLALAELKKYDAVDDFRKFAAAAAPERSVQLEFLDDLITVLKKSTLEEAAKISIISGALLDVKQQIANTYWVQLTNRSLVHAGIDAVMGVSVDNVLDKFTQAQMKRDFIQFMLKPENSNLILPHLNNAHLLKLNLTPEAVVTPAMKREIASTANMLQTLKADAKQHIVVTDKTLDTTHMHRDSTHQWDSKHPWMYSEHTPDYIKADANIPLVEQKLAIEKFKSHMRRAERLSYAISDFDKTGLKPVVVSAAASAPVAAVSAAAPAPVAAVSAAAPAAAASTGGMYASTRLRSAAKPALAPSTAKSSNAPTQSHPKRKRHGKH